MADQDSNMPQIKNGPKTIHPKQYTQNNTQ
jgi:hypothetical protein